MHSRFGEVLLAVFVAVTLALEGTIAWAAEEGKVTSAPEGPLVEIDGQLWTPQNPPLRMKGVVLAPMRELFETLQASIEWDAQTKSVKATRDGKTLQFWMGTAVAMVNNVPTQMASPPLMLGETMYVPVSLAAVAFGGEAEWDADRETLVLTFHGGTLTQIVGTLTQVYEGPPAALLLFDTERSQHRAVPVSSKAAIHLQPVGQASVAGSLSDLRIGDLLALWLDDAGQVVRIRSQYDQLQGTVGAVSQGQLLLEDGKKVNLMDSTEIVDEQANPVAPDRVGPGAVIRARVNPTTWETGRIVVLRPAVAPTAPEVRKLALVAPKKGYAPGATLKVQLLATPKGQATFDIKGFETELPMVEVRPGVYEGTYTVPAGARSRSCTLAARLRVGDQVATATMQDSFWVDSVPPAVTEKLPKPDAPVQSSRPTLSLSYLEAGSGLDPQSVKLVLDGKTVTKGIKLGTGVISYDVTEPLADGMHTARFEFADAAGNTTHAEWRFLVTSQAGQKIEFVRHNATEPLAKGEKLIVTVRTTEPGKRCWVTVGDLSFDLKPDRSGKVFAASHIVAPGEVINQQVLQAFFIDEADKQYNLAAGTPVTLRGDWVQEVEILSPKQGEVIRSEFTVKGAARPGATVRVTVTYLKKKLLVFEGNLYQAVLTADDKGNWETPEIDPDQPILGLSDSYKIIAELLDAEGGTVSKAEVSLLGK